MADDQQYRVCDESDQEFLDGIAGTISACANLSAKLGVLKETTAVCMRSPLGLLVQDFLSLKQAYHILNGLLDRQKPIWSPAATVLIHSTQERCQEITTQLSEIVDNSTEWHILAPQGSLRSLKKLSASFAVQKSRLELLIAILGLVRHISSKPAQHESPDSIVIPEPRSTYGYHPSNDLEVRAVTKRRDAALYAALNMEDWSKNLGHHFAYIRGMLQAKIPQTDTSLERQAASGSPHDKESGATSEDSHNMEDWSSTQSTTGIMTPSEDWSDIGSETTETGRAPAITRHSLQLCGYATTSFLRLIEEVERSLRLRYQYVPNLGDSVDAESIQRLHKAYDTLAVQLLHGLAAPIPAEDRLSRFCSANKAVTRGNLRNCIKAAIGFLEENNIIEESFGHLPGSTPVYTADIIALHRAYEDLVCDLLQNLAAPMPFQNERLILASTPTSAPAATPAPGPPASRPIDREVHWAGTYMHETLLVIIESMEDTPTDKDIMKLVFHWTILDECNNFKRADELADERFVREREQMRESLAMVSGKTCVFVKASSMSWTPSPDAITYLCSEDMKLLPFTRTCSRLLYLDHM
ncbi:hypothetical protein KCU65_g236, partial [Aureobasidium melanogenum]